MRTHFRSLSIAVAMLSVAAIAASAAAPAPAAAISSAVTNHPEHQGAPFVVTVAPIMPSVAVSVVVHVQSPESLHVIDAGRATIADSANAAAQDSAALAIGHTSSMRYAAVVDSARITSNDRPLAADSILTVTSIESTPVTDFVRLLSRIEIPQRIAPTGSAVTRETDAPNACAVPRASLPRVEG